MYKVITIIILLIPGISFCQTNKNVLDKLVNISEIYSENMNIPDDDEYINLLEKERVPELNHLIDALVTVKRGDEKILTKEFLSKPDLQELKYWYVLREIHYNNKKEEDAREPAIKVAEKVLEEEIDERWLLIDYYYRIHAGIAKLFNTADLSDLNIDLENYGLKNETEKAILFFALTDALVQRFSVLYHLKNYDKILEFSGRLPSFNGQPYYKYTDFDFEDFEWIGYDEMKSYKEVHVGGLFAKLFAHLTAYSEKEKIPEAQDLYFNSILSKPEYFHYSPMEADLQALYDLRDE